MYKIENHPIIDLPKEEYVEFRLEEQFVDKKVKLLLPLCIRRD